LEHVLAGLGLRIELGAGLSAAQQVYAETEQPVAASR
jgi:hypothetical protein